MEIKNKFDNDNRMAMNWLKYRRDDLQYKMDAVDLAIKAMEKQVPRKPIPHGGSDPYYKCPICGEYELSYNCENYCPKCGQRFMWD